MEEGRGGKSAVLMIDFRGQRLGQKSKTWQMADVVSGQAGSEVVKVRGSGVNDQKP